MDLRKEEVRKQVIADIRNGENQDRKDKSFRASEIFNGRLRGYVYEHLITQFHKDNTVKQMPLMSGTNLARRVSKEKASIFNDSPERIFTNVSEEQEATLQSIYKSMGTNHLMSTANESFCLQNQCMLQVYPHGGELKMRVLKLHHYDIVPMHDDPTEALAVVINSFDKDNKRRTYENESPMGNAGGSRPNQRDQSDGRNQAIADEDDKLEKQRFEVWSREYTTEEGETIPALNFVMTGKGQVLSQDPLSPMSELPFVDICNTKDFSYFASDTDSLVQFTIDYNSLMSELAHNNRMQNWSQAVLKAPKKFMPSTVEVGVTKIICLPSDSEEGVSDFSFATPGNGTNDGIAFAETILAQWLSCNGIDPSVVSSESGQRYSSGIERLLAQIEKFESSKSDYQLFERVEGKLYGVITGWLDALRDTNELNETYKMQPLPQDAMFSVTFSRPEGAQTLIEKVGMQERLIEMGVGSRVTACMDLYELGREEAEAFLSKIEEDESLKLMAEGFASPQIELPGMEGEGPVDTEGPEPIATPVSEVQVSSEEMIEKDVVLNGAQVTSMVGIVSSVAKAELPRGTGISILMTAFGLTKEKAEEIMGESGRSFKISKE